MHAAISHVHFWNIMTNAKFDTVDKYSKILLSATTSAPSQPTNENNY